MSAAPDIFSHSTAKKKQRITTKEWLPKKYNRRERHIFQQECALYETAS